MLDLMPIDDGAVIDGAKSSFAATRLRARRDSRRERRDPGN